MTGASGNMGREALSQTLELKEVEFVKVLLTNKKKNDALAEKLRKRYGDRIGIIRGSVADREVCAELVKDADYVIHMAAVIPPASDANPADSEECNKLGAVALIDAVKACVPQPSYIHISTVALYGNRNEKHLFARVGDPLLVSPFDCYAMHKLYGERYCLDAELERFVVLRQTAMLYPEMMENNIKDGLMFHTALNAPLEWDTSRDSGYLIKRILERDAKGEIDDFWQKIYNIGAGIRGRETGYDTFNDGFAMIGGSTESFFKPNQFATRNFHGVWFADADELQKLFGYQRDGVHEYWREIAENHKLFSLGKYVPKGVIKKFLFEKLLNHSNSPIRWIKDGDVARVTATFGSLEKAKSLPEDWKDCKLIAKGDFGDYESMKDEKKAKEQGKLVFLGYNEDKIPLEWTMQDVRAAALFRGGEVLSESYEGAYKKLKWRCHDGHEFEAAPYTVLKGGHWCPECCQPTPWDFDRLSKNNPFFAQIWYDSHDKNEDNIYDFDETGKAVIRKNEK